MLNYDSNKWKIMQILNEFVISMILLYMYLVAQAMSFQTKNELSHAHVQSVKQWDTTAQLFLARL